MLKYILLLLLVVSSPLIYAKRNLGTCTYIHGLAQGLNMQNFEECSNKINACPKQNKLFAGNECVSKVVEKEAACRQLVKVAKRIQVSPQMVNVQAQGNFAVLDVSFPADGGHMYYILSPYGCLINTAVDPRDINSGIQKRFAKSDFYVETTNTPSYTNANGIQRFTASINAKKQCRACEVLATAQINFDFNKDGKWLRTSLEQFKAN